MKLLKERLSLKTGSGEEEITREDQTSRYGGREPQLKRDVNGQYIIT